MPRISKKKLLREYLDERKPAAIGDRQWRELTELLAPVSENYLREILEEACVPVEPPHGGVRQHSLEDLEASLTSLALRYATADRDACRRAVIAAKDRATLAARNPRIADEKRRQKEEMRNWMLVWLENPSVFEPWVKLRKQALIAARSKTL